MAEKQPPQYSMALLMMLCAFCSLVVAAVDNYDDVIVTTRLGRIRGFRRREDYDIGPGKMTSTVDVFLGVPYAEPPIGRWRFQPPQKARHWGTAPYNARVLGPVCPQEPYYSQTTLQKQSEDCLYLNIYTPWTGRNARDSKLYPIMMFIHGGSYEEGSGDRYDGFTLAQHGVVVITINYRLGELGYLTTGDSVMPGNYGLLDQIESLKWVSENIGSFRGDSSKVTVFGSSAGSASTGFLMLSPYAKGLFHRAILHSGSPLAFWAYYNSTVDHRSFAQHVAQKAGCEYTESADVMRRCLQGVPVKNILGNRDNYDPIVPSQLNFKPRVDGDIIPDDPEYMFSTNSHHGMPIMIGVLEDEWARSLGFFFRELEAGSIDQNFTDGFDRLSFVKSVHHVVSKRFYWPALVADAIIQEYTNWQDESNPYNNRRSYEEFMSDVTMVAPSVHLARLLSREGRSQADIYFYNYQHPSHLTDPAWWGTYHSLELDAVFGSPFNGYDIATDKHQVFTEADKEVSRKMMIWWTNFAKFGSPNSAQEEWDSFKASSTNVFNIKHAGCFMEPHFRARAMAFWNNFLPKVLHELKRGVTSLCTSSLTPEREQNQAPKCPENLYTSLWWIFIVTSAISFVSFVIILTKYSGVKTRLTAANKLLDELPCTAV